MNMDKIQKVNIHDDQRQSEDFIKIKFDYDNVVSSPKDDNNDLKIDIINENEQNSPDIHLIIEQEDVINEYEEIQYDDENDIDLQKEKIKGGTMNDHLLSSVNQTPSNNDRYSK